MVFILHEDLTETNYGKTLILQSHTVFSAILHTLCMVPERCPKESFPDFMLSCILHRYMWSQQTRKIEVLSYSDLKIACMS
jgi:hypothetical protein